MYAKELFLVFLLGLIISISRMVYVQKHNPQALGRPRRDYWTIIGYWLMALSFFVLIFCNYGRAFLVNRVVWGFFLILALVLPHILNLSLKLFIYSLMGRRY